MTYLGEMEPSLDLKQANPQITHTNWLIDKLHSITMNTEMKIKGETMGFGPSKYRMIAEMVIAHGTSEILRGIDSSGLSETLLTISKSLPSYLGLNIYLAIIFTYVNNNVNLIRQKIQKQKSMPKMVDFSKKKINIPKEI